MRVILFLYLSLFTFESSAKVAFAVGDHYPPFSDKKTPGKGLAVKLVDRVMQHAGLSYELEWLPWKRGIMETLSGNFMATFPNVKNAKNSKNFYQSLPLFHVRSKIYVKGKRYTNFKKMLSGKYRPRVCIPFGYDDQYLKKYASKIHIRSSITMKSCFRMLSRGYVDAVNSNSFHAQSILMDSEFDKVDIHPLNKVLGESDLVLLVPKNKKQGARFIRKFNRSLLEIRNDAGFLSLLKEVKVL